MADSDQSLKLLIELGVIGQADAKAANDLLRETAASNSSLNEAAGNNIRLSSSLQDETKKSGEAIGEAGISARHLGHALNEVGNIAAPGAGRALSLLRYGPFGAVLALVAAAEKLKEHLEDIEKEGDALNEQEFTAHVTAIENVWKAWDDTRQSYFKYLTELRTAGEANDPAAEQLKRIQTISAAQTEANLKLLEEYGKLEIAWLKAHGATPDRIAAAEAANQAALESAKNSAANRSLDQIQQDIDLRKERRSDFSASVDAETERAERAQNALDRAHDLEKTAKGIDRRKLVAQQAEAEGELQYWTGQRSQWIEKSGSTPEAETQGTAMFAERIGGAQKKLDTATNSLASPAEATSAAQRDVSQAEAEKAAADEALAKARKDSIANETVIGQETREVSTGRELQIIKETGEKNLEAGQRQEKAIEIMATRDPNTVIASGAAAVDDLKHLREAGYSAAGIKRAGESALQNQSAGRPFDPQAISRLNEFIADQNAIDQFNTLLTSIGENQAGALTIMKHHATHFTSLADEVRTLQTFYATLERQVNVIQQNFQGRR